MELFAPVGEIGGVDHHFELGRSRLLAFVRITQTQVRTVIPSRNFALSLSLYIYIYPSFLSSHSSHCSLYRTEPIKIAWFSAGAFVLLTFPISMYGIIMHLSHYNQPLTQMYIVRILWMVPIYSIESWLAMRFHEHAIYIETLRDFYESYVLYSFLQFLIQVLGGEESLILMLKDKSPTRGFHMWGFQWCLKPWIMGQPVRKTVGRSVKRVHWMSPFYKRCKFGVLQYVLLKFLSAIVVLLLEWKGHYQEGDFSWSSGYLYICIVTNLSQCWALYCMIFFYYATKNELAPIRPVGKFLSVKALVFFTWWQSVVLAILYQWGMIPEQLVNLEQNYTEEDAAKGIQDYLICIEMFAAALVHSFVFPHTEYLSHAVRARNRALQRNQGEDSHKTGKWKSRRLGRSKFHPQSYSRNWVKDDASKSSNGIELASFESAVDARSIETWEDSSMWQSVQPQQEEINPRSRTCSLEDPWEFSPHQEMDVPRVEALSPVRDDSYRVDDDSASEGDDEYTSSEGDDDYEPEKTGFIRALIESAIPRDLGDSTLGIVKGDYHVEKKTLLSVAATSDQYDLFAMKRLLPRKEIPP